MIIFLITFPYKLPMLLFFHLFELALMLCFFSDLPVGLRNWLCLLPRQSIVGWKPATIRELDACILEWEPLTYVMFSLDLLVSSRNWLCLPPRQSIVGRKPAAIRELGICIPERAPLTCVFFRSSSQLAELALPPA